MDNSIFLAEQFTDRTLIESVLASFYILDYGYIKTVNTDKTVDVIHAKRLKTLTGKNLPQTETKGLEVLTIAGSGFSIQFDYKKGDKVLLLGLKDYIPKTEDVNTATETTNYMHYTRETLKAIPLCVFNDEAKVQIKIEEGMMDVETKDLLKLDGDDNGGLVIGPELKTQLGYLTNRVDTIISALENSPTAAQDGGATYKAAITTALQAIPNKEDFSNIESDKVKHGKGAS